MSSVACLAVPHFSILSHKRHDFRRKEKIIEYKMRVFILSETCLTLRRGERDMIKMYIGLHAMYRYSCETLMKPEFS
jgi:hypothetical protein